MGAASVSIRRNIPQILRNGHKAYLNAVEKAFGDDIDYAQLVKLYGAVSESAKSRSSPADCIGARLLATRKEPHQHGAR